jgi:hypothetical protein
MTRNLSEKIVDKDNHAVDTCKYLVMSCPEASGKPFEQRESERFQAMLEEGRQMGLDPGQAMTRAMLEPGRITHEEQEEDTPIITYYGGNARHRLVEIQRKINRRYRGGRR